MSGQYNLSQGGKDNYHHFSLDSWHKVGYLISFIMFFGTVLTYLYELLPSRESKDDKLSKGEGFLLSYSTVLRKFKVNKDQLDSLQSILGNNLFLLERTSKYPKDGHYVLKYNGNSKKDSDSKYDETSLESAVSHLDLIADQCGNNAEISEDITFLFWELKDEFLYKIPRMKSKCRLMIDVPGMTAKESSVLEFEYQYMHVMQRIIAGFDILMKLKDKDSSLKFVFFGYNGLFYEIEDLSDEYSLKIIGSDIIPSVLKEAESSLSSFNERMFSLIPCGQDDRTYHLTYNAKENDTLAKDIESFRVQVEQLYTLLSTFGSSNKDPEACRVICLLREPCDADTSGFVRKRRGRVSSKNEGIKDSAKPNDDSSGNSMDERITVSLESSIGGWKTIRIDNGDLELIERVLKQCESSLTAKEYGFRPYHLDTNGMVREGGYEHLDQSMRSLNEHNARKYYDRLKGVRHDDGSLFQLEGESGNRRFVYRYFEKSTDLEVLQSGIAQIRGITDTYRLMTNTYDGYTKSLAIHNGITDNLHKVLRILENDERMRLVKYDHFHFFSPNESIDDVRRELQYQYIHLMMKLMGGLRDTVEGNSVDFPVFHGERDGCDLLHQGIDPEHNHRENMMGILSELKGNNFLILPDTDNLGLRYDGRTDSHDDIREDVELFLHQIDILRRLMTECCEEVRDRREFNRVNDLLESSIPNTMYEYLDLEGIEYQS